MNNDQVYILILILIAIIILIIGITIHLYYKNLDKNKLKLLNTIKKMGEKGTKEDILNYVNLEITMTESLISRGVNKSQK